MAMARKPKTLNREHIQQRGECFLQRLQARHDASERNADNAVAPHPALKSQSPVERDFAGCQATGQSPRT